MIETEIDQDYEDLFENAPCGYISFLPDGQIINANQTMLGWLGYRKDELVTKLKIHDLIPLGERIFFETHLNPLLRTQGFVEEISLHFIDKNKTRIPVLTSSTRRQVGVAKTAVNRMTIFKSTERVKFESELIAERKRAELATRVKADFLSMMSHEIRNPLNAIIGITNLFDADDMSAQQSDYVGMLKASADNLMNLLNSILDLSKIESGNLSLEQREFHLRKLIDILIRGWQGRANSKGISLSAMIMPEIPDVLIGDPVKLTQILSNLIGNAIKFTNVGSVTLRINAASITETDLVLSFAVIDTGVGIDKEHLSLIFEEFKQATYETQGTFGGTGLGLTISQKLAQLHGSKIEVTSQIGQGSTFRLSLRLKLGHANSDTAGIELIAHPSEVLQGLSILVVDDSEDNLTLMEHFFKKWKIKIQTAANGMIALERVATQKFDVILMDMQMPVLNGFEVAQKIRSLSDPEKSQVPIIAFSGSDSFAGEYLKDRAVFNDVIGKPFKPADLVSKLIPYVKSKF